MITQEDFGMKFTENPTSCGQWFCTFRGVCIEYGYVDNDGVVTRALGPWPEIPKEKR